VKPFQSLIGCRTFFKDINFSDYLRHPVKIFADNQCAISNSESDRITKQNKHSKAKVSRVREAVSQGLARFVFVNSTENKADFLTKVLSGPRNAEAIAAIGLV